MLQQERPEDYVIATGEQHSVRSFVEKVAARLGLSLTWRGTGVEEKGYDGAGRCLVAVDPRYFRPAEVDTLLGNPEKARKKLGWTPKTSFDDLVREMVDSDLELARREAVVAGVVSGGALHHVA